MNDAHAAGELKLAEPLKTALSQLEQLARGEDVAWFVPPRPGSKYVDRAELHAAITAIDPAAQLVARLGETHLAGTPMAGALRGRLAAVDWGLVPMSSLTRAGASAIAL